MIVASMLSQYGVRMYSTVFRNMIWEEFRSLLVGLNGDTPLGNLIQIRLEDDPKVLEHFSSAQRKIRNEWRSKHTCVNMSEEEHRRFLAQLQNTFAKMGGGQ